MDTDVKRKSKSRELRKAEGGKDKEGRLLALKPTSSLRPGCFINEISEEIPGPSI